MRPSVPQTILAVAGLLLLFVGSGVLFIPEAFAAANGVALDGDPSALSEYRAPGGMLIAGSVVILLGAVRPRHARLGLSVAALIYGSYGTSRLVAMAVDGMPSAALVQAMAIELILGAICLAALLYAGSGSTNAGGR